MGPPPNPQRRRRNATLAMTSLPAEGRRKRPPVWPLPADVRIKARLDHARRMAEILRDDWASARDGRTARSLAKKLESAEVYVAELEYLLEHQAEQELALWRDLWRTPQAVMWERLRWTREVALYTRLKVLAENGDLDSAKEARQLSDRIGLTPLAMLRLRWTIAESDAGASRGRRGSVAAVTALDDYRDLG